MKRVVAKNELAADGWVREDFLVADEPTQEADPWDLPDEGPPSSATAEPVSTSFLDWTLFDDDALPAEDGLDDIPAELPWDEPTPTAEPKSDFSEALFPPDLTITDVSAHIRIDELLNSVCDLAKEQRHRCISLLEHYSTYRLRRIIPWLKACQWSGRTLLALLEFRRFWELPSNVHLWEGFWQVHGEWLPLYQSSTLSWEQALALVKNRLGLSPSQVIDTAWCRDWNNHNVWEMGIGTFAAFSLFRSALPPGDHWLEHLAQVDDRNAIEIAQCNDETFAPFLLPSISAQYDSVDVAQERHRLQVEINELTSGRTTSWHGNETAMRMLWHELTNPP